MRVLAASHSVVIVKALHALGLERVVLLELLILQPQRAVRVELIVGTAQRRLTHGLLQRLLAPCLIQRCQLRFVLALVACSCIGIPVLQRAMPGSLQSLHGQHLLTGERISVQEVVTCCIDTSQRYLTVFVFASLRNLLAAAYSLIFRVGRLVIIFLEECPAILMLLQHTQKLFTALGHFYLEDADAILQILMLFTELVAHRAQRASIRQHGILARL